MTSKCPNDHPQTWPCGKGPPIICHKCERASKLAKQQQQEELVAQERRDAEQKAHLDRMDALNAQIEQAKSRQVDARLAEERANAIKQKEKDLESILTNQMYASPSASQKESFSSTTMDGRGSPAPIVQPPSTSSNTQSAPSTPHNNASSSEQSPQVAKSPILDKVMDAVSSMFGTFKSSSTHEPTGSPNKPASKPFKDKVESSANKEWSRQKRVEGAQNDAIDSIMSMIGLESIKDQALAIKAKIDTSIRQSSSLKKERFNAVFLGNPGTGNF